MKEIKFNSEREIADYFFNREFQCTDFHMFLRALGHKGEDINEYVAIPSDACLKQNFLEDNGYKKWLKKYQDDFEKWKEEIVNDHCPMWYTIFKCDDFYVDSEYCNVDKLWELGIGLICHPEYGNFLFINGAGYDFYDAHWIPLFKMLKWIQ